jgi:hypothetical protein
VVLSRLLVAFDASAVCGAIVSRRWRGVRPGPVMRVALADGALVPSAFDPNLARADDVRAALARLRQALGGRSGRATLVLPDGCARIALLEPPSGSDPRAYARFRLASSLPYAAADAAIDVLPVGAGRFLAAAVRRSVVASYEAAAAAAGFVQEGVDLAPLAAVAGVSRRAAGGSGVVVILGDVAVSFAAFQDGAVRAFRSRRRDPGPAEAARLLAEARRTAGLGGDGAGMRLVVMGRGARTLVLDLVAQGRDAELGEALPDPGPGEGTAEACWLGAALS